MQRWSIAYLFSLKMKLEIKTKAKRPESPDHFYVTGTRTEIKFLVHFTD